MEKMCGKLIYIPLLMTSLLSYSQSREDTIKYGLSINYYKDLSDTYGGGQMFSGEFEVSKSWYGAAVSFNTFQSQTTYIFYVPLDESEKILEIPFEEMAIMKMGTLSLTIIPVQKRMFITEILFGVAYAKAERSCFKSVEFSYSTTENRFISLSKDYQLVRDKHFGYQVGIDLALYPLKTMGIKLNARIQGLNNGGSFLFVGGGLCFRL